MESHRAYDRLEPASVFRSAFTAAERSIVHAELCGEDHVSDDLVYRIFVEIAVLEGKRDIDGRWLISDPQEISRLLKRAYSSVIRASSAGDDDAPSSIGRGGGQGGARMNPTRP